MTIWWTPGAKGLINFKRKSCQTSKMVRFEKKVEELKAAIFSKRTITGV